jgi:hypothetical protein
MTLCAWLWMVSARSQALLANIVFIGANDPARLNHVQNSHATLVPRGEICGCRVDGARSALCPLRRVRRPSFLED